MKKNEKILAIVKDCLQRRGCETLITIKINANGATSVSAESKVALDFEEDEDASDVIDDTGHELADFEEEEAPDENVFIVETPPAPQVKSAPKRPIQAEAAPQPIPAPQPPVEDDDSFIQLEEWDIVKDLEEEKKEPPVQAPVKQVRPKPQPKVAPQKEVEEPIPDFKGISSRFAETAAKEDIGDEIPSLQELLSQM